MKLLIAFVLTAAATSAMADAATCYSINDADARSYCIAKSRQDPSTCYTIQRGDLRSMCLAEVRK